MENFGTFCAMLKRRCPNLEKIELHTKRPDEAAAPNLAAKPIAPTNPNQPPNPNEISPSDKRKNFLDDLRERFSITLDVKEYDHNKAPLHGRYTR